MANPHGQFEWKRRRRIIYAALIFCALEVAYLTVLGTDSALNATIVTSLILLAGSIIGTYVFGAVFSCGCRRPRTGGGGARIERRCQLGSPRARAPTSVHLAGSA